MNETLLDKDNMTVLDRLRSMAANFGLPRLIIAGFLLLLFIAAPFVGADFWTQISNTINRFSWNAVMAWLGRPTLCGSRR